MEEANGAQGTEEASVRSGSGSREDGRLGGGGPRSRRASFMGDVGETLSTPSNRRLRLRPLRGMADGGREGGRGEEDEE